MARGHSSSEEKKGGGGEEKRFKLTLGVLVQFVLKRPKTRAIKSYLFYTINMSTRWGVSLLRFFFTSACLIFLSSNIRGPSWLSWFPPAKDKLSLLIENITKTGKRPGGFQEIKSQNHTSYMASLLQSSRDHAHGFQQTSTNSKIHNDTMIK